MPKPNGSQAVRGMRDDFVKLVTAYNHVGLYEHARNAQKMVVILHQFEERHNLMPLAWPPVLIPPLYSHDGEQETLNPPSLEGAQGTELTAEDL